MSDMIMLLVLLSRGEIRINLLMVVSRIIPVAPVFITE